MKIERIEQLITAETEKDILIKKRLNESIEKMYKYLMFVDNVQWISYNASVGFKMENLGYYEPSLQRLLSLLRAAADRYSAQEYIELVRESIRALKEFDYKKEVLPEYHQNFLESGTLGRIKEVIEEFEIAIKDAEKIQNKE